jgi:hypothetical protein
MGSSTVRSGIFLATDRRLIFYAKKMGGYDFESFPYANVSSFEQSKGMMGHSMRFFASGNTRMIDGQICGQSARVISEYSTVTRGVVRLQVRGNGGSNRFDSQSDSAGSIFVTRSTHEDPGRE